jgi:8-oxo-dGTP diphosphatase
MNEHRWKPLPVVVLTALDLEYEAVRNQLTDLRPTPPVAGTRPEVGSLPGGTGDVVLVLTGTGNHASAVITERVISMFKPAAVLFVGVAGRLTTNLNLGDIVVGTHVYAYHGAAVRPDGLKARPRVWDIDHGIEQAAHQLRRRYDRERAAHPSTDSPRVFFGPIVSGEILHDAPTSEPLNWIREHYEDAVAIEMEAAGFAKAGQLNTVPGAVIRAISDLADGTKTQTDVEDWQTRAVRNAAAFAITLAGDLAVECASETGSESSDPTGIRVETHGGSHGAVAGVIRGGVHNTYPGAAAPPRTTKRRWS